MILAETYFDALKKIEGFGWLKPEDHIMDFSTHERLKAQIQGNFSAAVIGAEAMANGYQLAANVMSMTPMGLVLPFIRTGLTQAANELSARATWTKHFLLQQERRIPLDFSGATINGKPINVAERCVYETPFVKVMHLERTHADGTPFDRIDPPLKINVPNSGHTESLLQETFDNMGLDHEVYYVAVKDAARIPVEAGEFGYHDYINTDIAATKAITDDYAERVRKARIHSLSVCQPGPLAFIAGMKMAKENDPQRPRSLISLASPNDARKDIEGVTLTEVNHFAHSRPLSWFENTLISKVPAGYGYEGVGRDVYPYFLQRAGFVAKSIQSHAQHADKLLVDLKKGNAAAVAKKIGFDNVFLFDVQSLTRLFYLETIKYGFQDGTLMNGQFIHDGVRITGAENHDIALAAAEGKRDDVTGSGQCRAVLGLCPNLPDHLKFFQEDPLAAHYSIFSGPRWHAHTAPFVRQTIRAVDPFKGYSPSPTEITQKRHHHAAPQLICAA